MSLSTQQQQQQHDQQSSLLSSPCLHFWSTLVPMRYMAEMDVLEALSSHFENNNQQSGPLQLHKMRQDLQVLEYNNSNLTDEGETILLLEKWKTYAVALQTLKEQEQQQQQHNNRDKNAQHTSSDNNDDNNTQDIQIDWPWISNNSQQNYYTSKNDDGSDHNSSTIIEVYNSIDWEYANVVWNIAVLESLLAANVVKAASNNSTDQNCSNSRTELKRAWQQAGTHLQRAASIVHYLRTRIISELEQQQQHHNQPLHTKATVDTLSIDSSLPTFLYAWEQLLLAEAQGTAYYFVKQAARPPHVMLAKVAAATVTQWQKVGACIIKSSNDGNTSTLFANMDRVNLCNDNDKASTLTYSSLWDLFNTACRANAMTYTTWSEYHQALVHQAKREWTHQAARLHNVWQLGQLAVEYCQVAAVSNTTTTTTARWATNNSKNTHECININEPYILMAQDLQIILENSEATLQHLEEEHDHEWEHVPDLEELPEIPLQVTVKIDENGSRLLQPQNNVDGTSLLFKRRKGRNSNVKKTNNKSININDDDGNKEWHLYVERMKQAYKDLADLADEQTKQARLTLARVNLPHSVELYQQRQSGGGIPLELWRRVQDIQQNETLSSSKLHADFWDLHDRSEVARNLYQSIEQQLDKDLEMDKVFRQKHVTFDGHNVVGVQASFRKTLHNYFDLMEAARNGDSHVLKRLELLDTDPKFKLLHFRKSQLDRLLPQVEKESDIDVEQLNYFLLVLSGLLDEREKLVRSLLHLVRKEYLVQIVKDNSSLQRVIALHQEQFDSIRANVVKNFEMQPDVIQNILSENKRFVQELEMLDQINRVDDPSVTMIADAVNEVEQLVKHTKEGKDFYDVVVTKLGQLSKQVGDVSTRLAVERYEYEDNAQQRQQLEDDARIAASMETTAVVPRTQSTTSSAALSTSLASNRLDIDQSLPSDVSHLSNHLPDIESVVHDEPDASVDDSKVASLVAMDFDTEKVVNALKKYNNNFEEALNELLTG